MCLAVPGRVLEITRDPALGIVTGKARFGGIVREVNLTYTPDVKVGEFVVVHVGFALSTIAEQEAREVFRLLEEMGELKDLDTPEEGR